MEAKTKIFGEHDAATIRQIETCVAAGGERGVLCADGHKGYAQPIGGVIAYKDKISLSGVGFDIACGNLAIRTDVTRPQLQSSIQKSWTTSCAAFRSALDTKVKRALSTSCSTIPPGSCNRCAV